MNCKHFDSGFISKLVQDEFWQNGQIELSGNRFNWNYVFNKTCKPNTQSKRLMSPFSCPDLETVIKDELCQVWKDLGMNTVPHHSYTNVLVREKGCEEQLYHRDNENGYIAIWPLFPYASKKTTGYDINVIKVCSAVATFVFVHY